MIQLKVLDLFAGAGGFSLGFEMASFDIIGCLEYDKWACDTLRENKRCEIIEADITEFKTSQQISEAFASRPDVIIGGPPCQGYSIASKAYDPSDPRNSLFENFAQWIDVLKPSVFVMENVHALTFRKTTEGSNVIDIIKQRFEEFGYNVGYWTLNAVNYGVPQMRERVFIFGTRREFFGSEMLQCPKPTRSINEVVLPVHKKLFFDNLPPATTVQEAIGDLPTIQACEGSEEMAYIVSPQNEYQKLLRVGSTKVFNHVAMNHTKRMVKRYEQIIKGVDYTALEDELKIRKRNGKGIADTKFNSNYRLLEPNKESYTIPASFYSNFVHPFIPRNITAREAARLQSFPDYYKFMGKRTQISSKLLGKLGKEHEDYLSQYNQIGNAVPPLMAKEIAKSVKNFLTQNLNKGKNRNSKVALPNQVAA